MNTGIELIEYYLPVKYLENKDFGPLGIDPQFMSEKIGIERRYIAAEDESVGDMAVKAGNKLFEKNEIDPMSIDALILCTQNPDYSLPTTACIIQDRLKLSKTSMCFDINLGCSGFVYSAAIAKSLIGTFNYENVLVITSEAYSKIISYEDKTTATIFSDGAAACLIKKNSKNSKFIDFNFGTDGEGYKNLIVPVSGSKARRNVETAIKKDILPGIRRSEENLFMDGHEITKFVFREIPKSINDLLKKTGIKFDEINRFIFHQANKYMLESLSKRMFIPLEKMYIDLTKGNTVSSTIPIALKDFYNDKTNNDHLVLLSGFGVGYSWASAILELNNNLGAI